MNETNFLEIQNYFENLVHQSTFLKDFTGIFSREYHKKKNDFGDAELKSPALILFKYELANESNGQNTLAVRKLGFSIIFTGIDDDDIALQYAKVSEAEQLALKVLARIRYDSTLDDHVMYNCYLPNTVSILPVELSDSNFGVDVFLSLKNAQSMEVTLDDWQDITTLCP